jgi:hypothetical protein
MRRNQLRRDVHDDDPVEEIGKEKTFGDVFALSDSGRHLSGHRRHDCQKGAIGGGRVWMATGRAKLARVCVLCIPKAKRWSRAIEDPPHQSSPGAFDVDPTALERQLQQFVPASHPRDHPG